MFSTETLSPESLTGGSEISPSLLAVAVTVLGLFFPPPKPEARWTLILRLVCLVVRAPPIDILHRDEDDELLAFREVNEHGR